jgi:Tfp pilus assembly protein PilF
MVAYLPFHALAPHVYDAAYAAALYSGFDYVVFSSDVSARYLADFREYPFQTSFYRAMERGFREVATFGPGLQNGPEIRVLRRRPEVRLPNLDSLPAGFFPSQKGNTPLAEYLSGLGTVLIRRGDETSGLRLLEESVTMDPKSAKAWGNLGSMHLRAGQLEAALNAFRQARELAPEDAEVLYNLGVLYDRMGEPRQASEAFQEVVGRDPGLEAAYLPLARALVEDDHYKEARVVLQGFLERFPRSPKRTEAETALRELMFMGPGHP